MLAAGFIASPALLTTRDVLGLYTGAAEMRPRAYALEVDPGTLGLWQNPFRFRVYQIQNRLGHARTD
jgi:hypothetical protein